MLNVMKAEWIKLRSTKALWWTSGLIIFFAVAMALLMGYMGALTLESGTSSGDPNAAMGIFGMLRPSVALSGLSAFGMMIILIQGVMTVTNEYSSGTQKTSLMATPARWKTPVAKLAVYGIVAVIVSFIAGALAILGMEFTFGLKVDNPQLMDLVGFSSAYVWSYLGRTLLYAFLSAMLAIGTAYLIRHTAGAIALLLLWKLILEAMVIPMIPKVRDWLPPWLPFLNMDNYVARTDTADVAWADSLGQTGSMLYFALWCVVVFVAGVAVLHKRDA